MGLREEVESVASSHMEILVKQRREGKTQEIKWRGDFWKSRNELLLCRCMACNSALLLIKWAVAASLLQSRKQLLWWLCSLAVEMQTRHFLGQEEKTKQAVLRQLQLSPMQEGSCQVTAHRHWVVTVMTFSEWLVFQLMACDWLWPPLGGRI